jgi:putative DNA primase/helicase
MVLSRLRGVKACGNGWSALCPGHEDHENSLSIGVGRGEKVLLNCFTACPLERIVAALGLQVRDLFSVSQTFGGRMSRRKRTPLTVEDLACDKCLRVDFLRTLGLENTPRGVKIPYRLQDGALAPRQRVRSALAANKGSFWTKGVGAIVPYGLWRLEEARKAGFIVFVEGEFDSWTLWFHGFPSLGFPSAEARKLEAPYLADIVKAYVVREPDDGGTTFVAGIAKRFHEIGWAGDLRCVLLPGEGPERSTQAKPERIQGRMPACAR